MLKRLQSFTSRALNILTVLRAHCPCSVYKDIQAPCSTVHTATCGQNFRVLTLPAPDLYYKRQNSFRKRSQNPGFPILNTCTQTKSRVTYHVNIQNAILSCWLVLKTSIINSYQAPFQSISDKMQEYILDKALPGSRQSDIACDSLLGLCWFILFTDSSPELAQKQNVGISRKKLDWTKELLASFMLWDLDISTPSDSNIT